MGEPRRTGNPQKPKQNTEQVEVSQNAEVGAEVVNSSANAVGATVNGLKKEIPEEVRECGHGIIIAGGLLACGFLLVASLYCLSPEETSWLPGPVKNHFVAFLMGGLGFSLFLGWVGTKFAQLPPPPKNNSAAH
jgi:hypothetical protein